MLDRAAGDVLAERALRGDRRALARLLSLVEDGTPEGQRALATLFPKAGRAHIVGFTGSTGAGNSGNIRRDYLHNMIGESDDIVGFDNTP